MLAWIVLQLPLALLPNPVPPTRGASHRECPQCQSTNTICTEETLNRQHWYCYACGRTFDVARNLEKLPDPARRPKVDR